MLWFIKKLFWQISLLEHTDEYSGRLVNMMYRLSFCNITHFFLNGRIISWKCGESLHTKKSHNLPQTSFPGLVVRLLRPILFFINSFYVAYLCDVICDLRRMSLHHDCCLMMSLRGLHQTKRLRGFRRTMMNLFRTMSCLMMSYGWEPNRQGGLMMSCCDHHRMKTMSLHGLHQTMMTSCYGSGWKCCVGCC